MNFNKYSRIQSSIIELHVKIEAEMKLIMLKQSQDVSSNYDEFEIYFETIKFYNNKSDPKGVNIKIWYYMSIYFEKLVPIISI